MQTQTQTLAHRDYFTDHSILRDPYAYFEAIRAEGPIYRAANGVVYVTGFDEMLEVLKNTADFSSVLSVQGPAAALPFTPEGSDISAQIEENRLGFLGGDLLVTHDGPPHAATRSLLSRLFTPSRLKANEAFIAEYSEEIVRDAVAKGGCDLVKQIATPFVTLVIADLLGVPPEDRQLFMDAIESAPPPGSLDADNLIEQNRPLVIMGMHFINYVTDRRENPRDDVLSELSNMTFPDGTTPDAMTIVRLATFLFGAGQDTSAKLLGNAMRFIIEEPGLQDRLRADPSLIPQLLEETLRLEGSTKMTARLAKRDTQIAGVAIPAGTKVMLALSAGNRDPRRWDDPQAFEMGRPKIKEHVGFGRGAHVCPGAPLARVEVRVILEKFLEHTSHIDFDESVHGPRGARTLDYEPSFIIRGLSQLHLKLTPKAGAEPVAAAGESKAKRGGIFGFGKKAEPKPTHYSTKDTKIGALLDDPAAKAVIDRHFPGVTADPRISMAKSMTFRTVQKFAPDMFTTEALDAADADLAPLAVR